MTLKLINIGRKSNRNWIVRNIDLEVNNGECLALVGPSGCGKSTTLRLIAGLDTTTEGKIFLDNTDITNFPIHKRAQIGLAYLPQEASIFRKLSVKNNIMAVLETRKGLDHSRREELLEKLISQLGLNDIRNTQGISLSGGERRRVEIARTLAIEPKFILLDEPFAGVDPISVLDIQRIIKDLANQNIGFLITDHNVRETLGICDRGYIVNEGKSIAYGTPDQILENKEVKKVYLGEDFRM